MRVQKTDWGEIQWRVKYGRNKNTSMNIGTVIIEPGKKMYPHIHYEEQFIYILEGTGVGEVNGKTQILKPGAMFHMEPGCTHMMRNTGNSIMRHLLVSNPMELDLDNMLSKFESGRSITTNDLIIAVEAVRTQFLENLETSYCIYDKEGDLILQGSYAPPYCQKRCNPFNRTKPAACMSMSLDPADTSEEEVECPYGLKVYWIPILFNHQIIGHIQGGHIRVSDVGKEQIEGVYDTPESTAQGVIILLRKVAKAIRNFCEFNQFREELFEKETMLADSIITKEALIHQLRLAEDTVTDLKINNHFLFNTLNSMASMAVEGGQMALYQSIIHLSKMFHYSVRTQGNLVTMKKEIEYVDAYLRLQELRYKDSLTFQYEIDDKLMDFIVPFNFLQPIVENAFAHGFHEEEKKRLKITIKERKEQVECKVRNCGKYLNREECNKINVALMGNTNHGLSMIHHKLKAIYGDGFTMKISSSERNGSVMQIKMQK